MRAIPKHVFKFKTDLGQVYKFPVIVSYPKTGTEITLKASHAKKSIQLGGVGNCQTCTVSCCVMDNPDAFPKKIGTVVDWTYSRVYIATRYNSNGAPTHAIAYRHNRGDIAKRNDTPGGQKSILCELEANGPQVIMLLPMRKRGNSGGYGGRGQKTGERTPPAVTGIGAERRFAFAKAGGLAA